MVGEWKVYGSFIPKLTDLSSSTFYCAFFTTSYSPAITDDSYSSITGEVANGNGYTTGGVEVTNVAFTETSGVWKMTCDDITIFTAAGADVTGRYAVIYDYTDVGKQLVSILALNTVTDIVVPDGTALTIENPSGVFTVGGW